MTYRSTRHDREESTSPLKALRGDVDSYDLLDRDLRGYLYCSDAAYEERPYYEIVGLKE